MLQDLRQSSQSIIAKIIVGFIIITFALWGVDSLVGLATRDSAPVTVNGVDISEQQILRETELLRRQLMAQLGENVDPAQLEDSVLRPQVVERLIERTLLTSVGRELGQRVGDSYLDQAIVAEPAFQVEGKFDREQFQARLRSVGLTPLEYRNLLREDALLGQQESAISGTAFALPEEARRVRALDRQERDLSYAVISLDDQLDRVTVSDEEIVDYYEANKSEFVAEEKVALEYIRLSLDALAAAQPVSEEEIQAAYRELVDGFSAEEARHAAHILVAVGPDRDEEAAKARAEEVLKRLRAGESFAELARSYSDDPLSAEAGGDLGIVEKGVMVPEFEEALFAMKAGEVSEPVKTEFGFHIIRLVDVEQSQPPSLEEAREGLVEQIRQEKAGKEFVKKLEELADLSFAAADLQEPSEALGLTIETTEPFTRAGGQDALTRHPRVIEAAFSPDLVEQGLNSQVIELGDDEAVVIRVRKHEPAHQLALDEVRDEVAARVRKQKAAELATRRAEEIARASRDGLSADVEWQTRTGVRRNTTGVEAEIVGGLFRLPRPQEGKPQVDVVPLADGSVAVVALTAVREAEATLSEDEQRAIAAFLASRRGQSEYRAWVSSLRAKAEIERL